MNPDQIQETCENLVLAVLNGGALVGATFRNDDSGDEVKADMVIAKAGAPVKELEGPMATRVEVNVTLKSKTAEALKVLHGEAFKRLTSGTIWHTAALATGMTEEDVLEVMTEEFGGDREETKNLRKRTILVPLLFRVNPLPDSILLLNGDFITFGGSYLTFSP